MIRALSFDGRDIGTVIYPDAQIKLFVTATPEKRAERRYKELQSRGISATYGDVLAEMQERDERDAVQLKAHLAPDHKVDIIDTSDMTPDEVMNEALKNYPFSNPIASLLKHERRQVCSGTPRKR